MSEVLGNIALVLLFVLIGGIFAGAEIALVSLREGQIRNLAQRGRRGGRVGRLADDPNRFLSAVQIGVTVSTFLASAFGAATLAEDVTPWFTGLGMSEVVAAPVAIVAITLVISYFSLVLGELVPKRLALQWAEGVSLALAPMLDRVATASRPVIWLLSKSTDLVVRLVGGDPAVGRQAITAEELRDLVVRHESLTGDERQLIADVFAAAERQVREVLVPRTEVRFLDADMPIAKAIQTVAGAPYSRFPVYRESHDEVVGFVHVRDLLDPELSSGTAHVDQVIRPVKFFPASKRLLPALSEMRREGHHLAIVVDEYGGTAGIVTLEDLVEELVGDIRDEYDLVEAQARHLHGGELEVDGLLNLDDFAQETGVELPGGPYETVAGYVMAVLGHVPSVGESVDAAAHRLTIIKMEGRRVARVRVTPRSQSDNEPAPSSQRES
ncbi:MAG: DUF21 domain-containing protein [Streptosporangiales bacterium]|nr:DUF21 domain-containing protein [Streptosporangiales bacterium]